MLPKLWKPVTVLILLATLAPACKRASPTEPAIIPTQTSSPPETAPAPEPTQSSSPTTPAAASVINIAMQSEPDNLHPAIDQMTAKYYILAPVIVGCLGQDETTAWIPRGCESVPTIANGGAVLVGERADRHLEVTYRIRPGWRWTDGQPVTAADAVYWWKLVMDPDLPVFDRTAYEKIYHVSAVDDDTILVKWMSQAQLREAAAGTLTGGVDFSAFQDHYRAKYGMQPSTFAFDTTFWANIGWLPEHVLSSIPAGEQRESGYAKKPLGDGPYVISEWVPASHLILKKSPLPFALGEVRTDRLVFHFYNTPVEVLFSLSNHQVDIAIGNSAGLNDSYAKELDALASSGGYQVDWVPGYALEHIDLNTTRFPLDDVRVRQALAYALDKPALIETVYAGKKLPTDLPIPPGGWAYPQSYQQVPYDFDKARRLLYDAGWDCDSLPCKKQVTEHGGQVTKKLEITLYSTDRHDRYQLMEEIRDQWTRLNAGVNIVSLYGRGLFAGGSEGGPLAARTFDAALYTWITGDDARFYSLYSCTAIPSPGNQYTGMNFPGWCSSAASEALDRSENVPDVALSLALRKPLLDAFFQAYTQDVPVIPLFLSLEPFPHASGLENFKPGPTIYDVATWNAWEWRLK